MAKRRDRRTKKDDVLCPIFLLPMLERMSNENAGELMKWVLRMGKAGNDAGFSKDTKEEVETSVERAVLEVLESFGNQFFASDADDLMKTMFMSHMEQVADRIIFNTVKYYDTSLKQKERRSHDLSSEQYEEFKKIVDGINKRGLQVTKEQETIIEAYVRKCGGTWSMISSAIMQRDIRTCPDPTKFDCIEYMKQESSKKA